MRTAVCGYLSPSEPGSPAGWGKPGGAPTCLFVIPWLANSARQDFQQFISRHCLAVGILFCWQSKRKVKTRISWMRFKTRRSGGKKQFGTWIRAPLSLRENLFDAWFTPKRFESPAIYQRMGVLLHKRCVPTGGDFFPAVWRED